MRPMSLNLRTPMAKFSLESPAFRWLIAGFFAAIYWMMAVTAAWDKSVTFDEIAHLTGGYTYWLRNDFRFDAESGVLPQRWATLPLLWMKPAMPPTDDPAWLHSRETVYGAEMLFHSGNNATHLIMAGRMMIALLGSALLLLVFQWSSELFGWRGGFISMLLCVFCPALLAHGALVTADMAVAFFFTFATWAFWRLCQRVTPGRMAVCALALTGLALSKMSGVIIIPVIGVLLIVRVFSRRPLIVDFRGEHEVRGAARVALWLGLILLANLAVVAGGIWAAYSFRYGMFNPSLPGSVRDGYAWSDLLAVKGLMTTLTGFARDHRLLPEGYLYGFLWTINSVQGRRSFLNGAYSGIGFPGFFPYAFLVKTPPAVFLLLAGAAVAGVRKWRTSGRWLHTAAPLLVLSLTYWVFALRSHINIGHRHLLPVYPAMYILAGACGVYFRQGAGRWQGLLVVAGLLWFTGESLTVRPDYLAYFNFAAGGPGNGWRHLVDSSLDWGQDLPALKRWLDARGANNPDAACLVYFGSAEPDYYGIKARRLTVFGCDSSYFRPLAPGVYCISATALQSVYTLPMGHWAVPYEKSYRMEMDVMRRFDGEERFPAGQARPARPGMAQVEIFEQLRFARLCAWLRQREPDGEAGHSILIYFVSQDQLNDALYGEPAELTPDVEVRQ